MTHGCPNHQVPAHSRCPPWGMPPVPVSLALIEHLHLSENPAPDVAQALLYDLEGEEGEAERCQGGAGAPLPLRRGDPRGRAGLRQQNRLFPAPVPSGSGRAKPLPPGPGPAELHVTLEQQRALCPTGR